MSELSSLLAQGLQSLSAGDDRAAFVALTQVMTALEQSDQVQTSEGWKAQMGLVTLHQRAGNRSIARALAADLSRSPNAKVQAWATAQLASLDATSEIASEIALEAPEKNDLTGFIPLDSSPEPDRRPRSQRRRPGQSLSQNALQNSIQNSALPGTEALESASIATGNANLPMIDQRSQRGLSEASWASAGFSAESPAERSDGMVDGMVDGWWIA